MCAARPEVESEREPSSAEPTTFVEVSLPSSWWRTSARIEIAIDDTGGPRAQRRRRGDAPPRAGRARRGGGVVLDPSAPPAIPGMAPLLRKLMADCAATGLPPAYLPKTEP